MAFTATLNFRNGMTLTGTGLSINDDTVFVTGSSGLTAIAGAGGLPTGVSNVDATGIVNSNTAFKVPVGYVETITIV